MRSASSALATRTKAWRPSSSTIRSESDSFIWQPKVWTNTLRTGAAPGEPAAGGFLARDTRSDTAGGN